MSDKKNMVIKVRYPASGKATEQDEAASKNITEWNFQRIGMALAGLIVAVLIIVFLSGDDKPEESAKQETSLLVTPPVKQMTHDSSENVNKTEIKPDTDVNDQKMAANPEIIRAQLTTDINKNEPVGTVVLPLTIAKNEKIGLYYFVELKGMKGKSIIHEWLLNDELVSQKKVNISADPWRTSSKQVISYTMNNDWKVRLIDDAGHKISETTFNLQLK